MQAEVEIVMELGPETGLGDVPKTLRVKVEGPLAGQVTATKSTLGSGYLAQRAREVIRGVPICIYHNDESSAARAVGWIPRPDENDGITFTGATHALYAARADLNTSGLSSTPTMGDPSGILGDEMYGLMAHSCAFASGEHELHFFAATDVVTSVVVDLFAGARVEIETE